ncbi:MAG: hypothetical protein ACU85E_08585 [Gammaproteobacteria bacterium]
MNKQQMFDLLTREFNLKPADFYFLELIPLIEMIWADGHNQPAELALLYKFTVEHMAHLDRASGIQFASVEDANDFLDRFAHQRPPIQLLEKLRELIVHPKTTEDSNRYRTIMNYCLDIAAACATQYPFGMQQRIIASEKELLNKLFLAFNCSADP